MNIKPYFYIFKAYLSKEMSYRFNFVFSHLFHITRLLIALAVWAYIFSQRETINHYSWDNIASYYALSLVVVLLFTPSHMFELQPLIRKGTLSSLLIKPMNFQAMSAAKFLATKLPSFVILSLFSCLIFCLLGVEIQLTIDLATICLLLVTLGCVFYFGLFISFLTFWLVEMWPIQRIFQSSMVLLGGGIAPLDLLPQWLQSIAMCTPFPYFGYITVKALQGAIPQETLWYYCFAIITWTLLFACLSKILWKKGLKRYEAVNL